MRFSTYVKQTIVQHIIIKYLENFKNIYDMNKKWMVLKNKFLEQNYYPRTTKIFKKVLDFLPENLHSRYS